MKKRKKIGLALACVAVAAFAVFSVARNGFMTGWYIQGANGAHIIIDKGGSPVIMQDRSRSGTLFDKLENGDKILVGMGTINQSFPAQGGTSWCLRLNRGSMDELSQDTLKGLAELGWLDGIF